MERKDILVTLVERLIQMLSKRWVIVCVGLENGGILRSFI